MRQLGFWKTSDSESYEREFVLLKEIRLRIRFREFIAERGSKGFKIDGLLLLLLK